jgi:hypothetical protein
MSNLRVGLNQEARSRFDTSLCWEDREQSKPEIRDLGHAKVNFSQCSGKAGTLGKLSF